MSRLFRTLGRVLLALLVFQIVLRLVRRFVKFPAPPFTSVVLASRWRRRIQPPEQVIDWVDVHSGMQVLEIGPGPGTFTVEAARRAGPSGQVYAIDIQPDMLVRLEGRVRQAGVDNISPRVASAYELPLPNASIDRAFLVTVLAEIPDKQRALAEIRRVLKPEGRLAVGELLFDPDYPRQKTVIRWCREAGFELSASHTSLLHYMLVFRPVASGAS